MSWEEEFDDGKLKTLLGGYCWSQDGGNGGYDYADIKAFIHQALDSQLSDLRKEIEKMRGVDNAQDNYIYRDEVLLLMKKL